MYPVVAIVIFASGRTMGHGLTGANGYNARMKFLFDLFPVILFFVAFKFGGIYVATGVAIAATFGQIGWLKMRGRKVDTMMWVSLGIIVVFGGATLLLHDETFIKWKPTVLYWFFEASLSQNIPLTMKNIINSLLVEQMQLPDPVWNRLNWSWTAFFTLMGVLNLYVAFNYPLDTWVNFKLFGGMGLMFVFVMAQAVFLAKHMPEQSKTETASPSPMTGTAERDATDRR